MKRSFPQFAVVLALLTLVRGGVHAEEDPFAAGTDALAVKASDGSSSVRARLKVKKTAPDVVQVQVQTVDAASFPICTFTARVVTTATSKAKHFQLIGRGKTYRFQPVMRVKAGQPMLTDDQTRQNLGACYYPAKTQLNVQVGGVDLRKKVFLAEAIEPK